MLLSCPSTVGRIMCFTLLFGSWLIVHGAPLAAAVQLANYQTPVDNVTLIFYKKPGSSEGGEDGSDDGAGILLALRTLSGKLDGLHAIPDCKDGDSSVCFSSSRCPGRTTTTDNTLKRETSTVTCSTLVYKHTETITDNGDERPTQLQVWGFGVVSVFIISLSGLFGGLLWPMLKTKYATHIMRILIGLAVGTLCSTSAFQLVPQSFGLDENDRSYLTVSSTILGSFWVLYMFEVLCKIYFYSKPDDKTTVDGSKKEYLTNGLKINNEVIPEEDGLIPKTGKLDASISTSHTSLHQIAVQQLHQHHHHVQMGGLTPVAWMIILGDGLHNFVDGMSIGAGFSKKLTTGLTISIAIACEEFPHELGDFAILVASGMELKKAILYNFLSALTAFGGLILGILLGELEANSLIFAFSGGLFLYISLTDLLPELNSMIAESLEKNNKADAILVLVQQNCGIILGFLLLLTITAFPISVG
ncbi:metal cation symporter ZIP8 isoform X2 [Anabrus simplex]|uniref:metal cation symporter ZIP8 isoform X2 n=1 Tax=Anabrus simplex TaxID=316456 RepID=UPI0035A268CD